MVALRVLAQAGSLLAGGLLLLLERRFPLRPAREPGWRRQARNGAVAALGGVTLLLSERPVARRLAALVARRRIGLLQRLPLPPWAEAICACVLLDLTLYYWHVLTHRLPWLWRFHLVHHVDLDLSATTALRFHFGELLASVAWRAAQVLVIGVAPRPLQIWQSLLLTSVLFHHANLRLPRDVDRWIGWLIMTPRLHGIHHSTVAAERDSNWSSGLTLWDVLHGTLCNDVRQEEIVIGVPGYLDREGVTLGRLLALPFSRRAPARQ